MPSKFTAERRKAILEVLEVGGSRMTAANMAGLDESTLRSWVKRGKEADEGSRYHEFYLQVLAAEAAPRVRALWAVHRDIPDKPELAFRYLERREPGFAPPQPHAPTPVAGPVIINVALASGQRPEPETVIDVQNVHALPDPSD